MAPKGGQRTLRPHSRSSSATKIATNLQFTQKEQVSRNPDRPKLKNGYDGHPRPIPSRVSSKDQLAPLNKRSLPPPITRSKPAFTVTVGPGDDEGDEDEWVSSESGINTPNPVHGSGSEDELDTIATPVEVQRNPLHNRAVASTEPSGKTDSNGRIGAQTPVPRVASLRPISGFDTAQLKAGTTSSNAPTSLVVRPRAEEPSVSTAPFNAVEPEPLGKKARPASMVQQGSQFESSSLDARPTALRPTAKRQSSTRPPSTHSISSKHDHAALRPHPLIRGHSFGQPAAPSRPAPLAPLTTSDAASTVPSSSPTSLNMKPSGSPSTISASPISPYPQSAVVGSGSHPRRTSVSSARSVATLPVHPSAREFTRPSRDRNRTLSTISQSSSSAAISSLAHLPTVTRPPTPQMISFFPPVNTHHTVEGIHPLLPPPYLSNHLTVLAYRTPLRESHDRILKAKAAR